MAHKMALMVICIIVLSSCGQTGPLTLPVKEASQKQVDTDTAKKTSSHNTGVKQ